jgi:SAM-dependent methyltransferase
VAALREAGAGPGRRCWEVGAGRGSIARWLAAAVGPEGQVVATDVDDRWYEGGVPLLRHDVEVDPPPGDGFDLVHARLLLEHLADPRAAIEHLARTLRPGGALVVEDAAGLDFVSDPPDSAFDRLAGPWELAAADVGWDATLGERLAHELRRAGLVSVRGREHRSLAPGGPDWAHVRAGLERLREGVLRHGAEPDDVVAALMRLSDPGTMVTGAPITTVWGRRE